MPPLFLLTIALLSVPTTASTTTPSCTSLIFCHGPLLDTIQRSRIFPDSKTFVDMKLKTSQSETLQRFNHLMASCGGKPTPAQIQTFVSDNFENGEELLDWNPPDYKLEPKFLDKIQDVVVREFARNLVRLWPALARRVNPEVARDLDAYSMIPVPNGFVVPGGRFQEMYYWDSYWIVKGLLISEMFETARGIVENLVSMVQRYGFVPTGNRIYYLDRSMPPLLTLMVDAYVKTTNDTEWLRRNVKYLDKELKYWLTQKTVALQVRGNWYTLARYLSTGDSPRPESYLEDVTTCSLFPNENDKRGCYNEIRTGAESGWDFSSRWLPPNSNLSFIQTTRIIPVDLNAFLCKSFKALSHFYDILNAPKQSALWLRQYQIWRRNINDVLWSEEHGAWMDYNFHTSSHSDSFYPSNLSPLWADVADPKRGNVGVSALNYLATFHIPSYPGGVPASLEETGQQWDFPNAWAPLQAIVVQGLARCNDDGARRLGETLAMRWLESNIRGYMETQEMFEKYDAVRAGRSGSGGEYVPQAGFGWTNGVALEFIAYYFVDGGVDYSYF